MTRQRSLGSALHADGLLGSETSRQCHPGRRSFDFGPQVVTVAGRLGSGPLFALEGRRAPPSATQTGECVPHDCAAIVKVENPKQELQLLLMRLVGPLERSRRAVAKAISTELEERFRGAGVEQRLQTDVTVHPPTLPKPFTAPFAYRNGRLNLALVEIGREFDVQRTR